MEVPIEAPLEIKKKIAKSLQKSGALKRIERKIKMGMMVAIEELRDPEPNPKVLEHKPFKNAKANELRALQVVYNYLSERNLTYTLSTLLEESCQNRKQTETLNLLDIINSQLDLNEEEDNISQDEKLKNLHPSQNVDKQDLFSNDDDENSEELSSPTPKKSFNNNLNDGTTISKSFFEKSPFIVSVNAL